MKNEYKVKEIIINERIRCYCPLGKDWYSGDLEAQIFVDEEIPDYLDVDNFIKNEIDGKAYIIEETAHMFYEYLMNTLHPVSLHVTATVKDATHAPVVIKIY